MHRGAVHQVHKKHQVLHQVNPAPTNLMSLLQTVLTDGDEPRPRWQTWLREMWRQKAQARSFYDFQHWSERAVIALVMQSLDNSITTYPKKTRHGWVMASRQWPSRRSSVPKPRGHVMSIVDVRRTEPARLTGAGPAGPLTACSGSRSGGPLRFSIP